jgi:hypothetical protein
MQKCTDFLKFVDLFAPRVTSQMTYKGKRHSATVAGLLCSLITVGTTIWLVVIQGIYFFSEADSEVWDANSIIKNINNADRPIEVDLNNVIPAFSTSLGVDKMIGMYW